MNAARFRNLTCLTGAFAFLLALASLPFAAAETNAPPFPPGTADTNASMEALRSYLELQTQLHAAQLAIERNRQENEAAANRNAEALTNALQLIKQSLADQQARELETMRNTSHLVLAAAATLAAVGVLALLLTAYLQWRAMTRISQLPVPPANPLALWPGRAYPTLGPGDMPLVSAGTAEQSSARLLGVIDRLERRIAELEHSSRAPLSEYAASADEPKKTPVAPPAEPPAPPARESSPSRTALLLAKGQALLEQEESEKALACFEEALGLEPRHPEALVKKGVALERLRRTEEAVRCYDDAIAADSSMTIAYLYKGGLFNRLERYNEALACYEQALRTQERRPA